MESSAVDGNGGSFYSYLFDLVATTRRAAVAVIRADDSSPKRPLIVIDDRNAGSKVGNDIQAR